MVGDAQVGKTTLMVKYVENKFDEEYIMTLGKAKTGRENAALLRQRHLCTCVEYVPPSTD